MELPKIDLPIYEVTLPSNGNKIRIRPFSVKEEKLLLMAVESDNIMDILNTTRQIINNCMIDPVNIEALPFFDIDYLFIALRAKSVSESVDVKYTCWARKDDGSECGNEFVANIDISDAVIVKDDTIQDMIDIGKNYKIKMKYPNYTTMKMILDNDNVLNKKVNIIAGSVEQIIHADKIYTSKDVSKAELISFVEGMTKEQFSKLEVWVDNFPSFVIKTKAVCPKCNTTHELEYSDFISFLD
jgi:hypothetical protein